MESLIISDPAVKLGRPVVVGTRLTVDEILDELAAVGSVGKVIENHPELTPEGVLAAVQYGAKAVRDDCSIDDRPAIELHGAHPVEIPSGKDGERIPGIAVRAFLPEAAEVSVRRLPAPPKDRAAWLPALQGGDDTSEETEPGAWQPMERIHPAGVFEAIFPGETERFEYQLTVTRPGEDARITATPYGLPPVVAEADLPELSFEGLSGGEAIAAALKACRMHDVLGAHPLVHAGVAGVAFAVWAPNAAGVSVVGDFNGWHGKSHPMRPVGSSGVWELFIPDVRAGARYKYRITTTDDGRTLDKADPYAFSAEVRPATASVVCSLSGYEWRDAGWMLSRRKTQALDRPISIYEVHLGSWRHGSGGDGASAPRWLTYRELADQLVPYVKDLGYTHIEPMPVSEHPYDGSWGYQVTGFFAPTSRYGTPDDFRYFVDTAHAAGLGVILDWVPGHFPKDAHGLAQFDGTPVYEHPDPRRSENHEWGTLSFNFEREEAAAFLLSNAIYWIEQFHVDGLRVDAVSSMIYLDYSRQHWVPNALGGRENLEAAEFLRRLNDVVHAAHPGVLMIAEESTAWPRVTGRELADSLGFDLKWNLGWMHDTLGYAQRDPVFRKHHHNELTFSLCYAFSENFLLPFSHDEVVHGKKSLLGRMPGDEWHQFANLRALYGYMYAHPGKKLHFMGSEFAPHREWNENVPLDWSLLDHGPHESLRAFVRDLNKLYRSQAALHERDFGWDGFHWLDCDDADRSVVSFLRRGNAPDEFVVVAVNFTPVTRGDYRLGVPSGGSYLELLNSDDAAYGGTNVRNAGPIEAAAVPCHGQDLSVSISLPPLGIVFLGRKQDALRLALDAR